jgi:hypothetical protein
LPAPGAGHVLCAQSQRRHSMSLAIVASGRTALGFNRETGIPAVLRNPESGREVLRNAPQPLFAITLAAADGSERTLTAADATTAHLEETGKGLRLWFNFLGGENLAATATVAPGDETALTFGIAIRNLTGLRLLRVEYPILLLPPDPRDPDADWAVWNRTLRNGVLVHGFENAFVGVQKGFDGSCSEPLQFAACGNAAESLYYATQDTRHYMKNLQPSWTGTHLRLSSTHYIDEADHTSFTLPYPVGIEVIADSSWCAAAEKYRAWAEKQSWAARKLRDRSDIPAWWLQSPIVLSIKERGKRNSDMGQRPSPWCHPLEKGIPRILDLARRFESTIKVQVFHWERNGAFINGEHFPPLSGFDGVKRFFDLLHENGHYGGVYILPLKWTLKGYATGFDGSRWFEQTDAMSAVCVDAGRRPIHSEYDWTWRKRLFMCGGAQVTRSEIVEAFRRFADLGADYIQFDTFNGRLYDCWSPDHGHYPGPGRWQNDLAVSLIEEIKAASKPFILTYESDPTEAMIPLGAGFVERGIHPWRHKGWEMIPLFQFVYHEYSQGFAGENCGSWNSPEHFYLMSALTIVGGDMLMINLSEEGRIAMQTHEIDDYDQTVESVFPAQQTEGFIRSLNRLRREHARDLLVIGRMERPPRIECAAGMILEGDDLHPMNADGHWKPSGPSEFHLVMPSVLGSSWTAPDGARGTVLVNYTLQPQDAVVTPAGGAGARAEIVRDDGSRSRATARDGTIAVTLPPLSSLVIRG